MPNLTALLRRSGIADEIILALKRKLTPTNSANQILMARLAFRLKTAHKQNEDDPAPLLDLIAEILST